MIRRPLLAAAALCATLTLTACNGSPEAGRPNTTPPPATTPTPTASITPTRSDEENKAITEAKARYVVARAAVGAALREPVKATRAALEKAGNGGAWVSAVAGQVSFQRENGWYQTGDVTIVSTDVKSVNLDLEQPEVRLTSCIDSSRVITRYQSNGQPIPSGSENGSRHRFQSKLVLAPASDGSKMWFLVEEKVSGSC